MGRPGLQVQLMREWLYRKVYQWVTPRYVEHCLTQEQKELYDAIESMKSITIVEDGYDVVFEPADEIEAFIQSQEETKH